MDKEAALELSLEALESISGGFSWDEFCEKVKEGFEKSKEEGLRP